METQQKSRGEAHVFTKKVSKTELSVNDIERLQTLDGVTTDPYSYGP